MDIDETGMVCGAVCFDELMNVSGQLSAFKDGNNQINMQQIITVFEVPI